MGRAARVKSIDALQAMHAALECFHDDTSSAIDDLEMEIRRALQWICQDCRQYWSQEVRHAGEAVTEAKLQLQTAMIARRIGEQRASCVVEKKALERAKRRLQVAESKVAAIPHWTVEIERAVNEYRGSRSQFVNWLEGDFPKAIAALGRMMSSLDAYVSLEVPVDEHSPIDLESITSTDDAKDDENTADAIENNPEPQKLNPES